ncbi:hypothetical protein HYPSUDRAFT_90937 [Hypholoma sublateritium FD-334 SS-4]|uniref:Uncharacterized protein n=1 Tax=Hypholoma sublateritium (strain FD-334 SS-4) TaxID=945553 RepID=A0A0D2M1L4_HYPSF|nr:hypothetical protein HYPSUDRAFT_90937 [Hypholoma sublateritium FD-334 SS-4]
MCWFSCMLTCARSMLEAVVELARGLTADRSLALFVLSGEDAARIYGYRRSMHSASKTFEVNFLQSIHFQLANVLGSIMKAETVKYREAGRDLGNGNQREAHISRPLLLDWASSQQVGEPLGCIPPPLPLDQQ